MSKLSRAVKFILVIWIVAFCFAVPQAMQFVVVSDSLGKKCTVSGMFHRILIYFFVDKEQKNTILNKTKPKKKKF